MLLKAWKHIDFTDNSELRRYVKIRMIQKIKNVIVVQVSAGNKIILILKKIFCNIKRNSLECMDKKTVQIKF